jgi:hypothetical protein
MKTLLIAAATAGLVVSAMLAPAQADGPKASGGNTWSGMSQLAAAPTAWVAPAAATPTDGRHWASEPVYNDRGEVMSRLWVLTQ